MTDAAYRVMKFQGALAPEKEPALRCAVSIRFHRWDPTSLDIELLWLGDDLEKQASARAVSYLPVNHLTIHSLDPKHPSVELFGISNWSVGMREAKIVAAGIEVGINKEPLSDKASYHVVARLQPSGILCSFGSLQMDYKGGIKVKRMDDGVVTFTTPVGEFEAQETYEYFSTNAHGNKVTEQIQRASIMGELVINTGDTLVDLHEKFSLAIDDVCAILSLCYRQPVSYYEIEYLSLADHNGWPTLDRRQWFSSRERLKGDELIAARNLTNGGLQKLLHGLQATPARESLLRSMQFLAASYEAALETGYFMAFSAMETAVNACLEKSERELASKAQWKKLEPFLREALTTACASLEMNGDATDEMKIKLPELRRASLQSRVEFACKRYEPKTSDLWRTVGFVEGIKQAAAVRNGLFHAADTTQFDEMHDNLIQVRIFTERLILQILKWPAEDIWVWYDQNLKGLNSRSPSPISQPQKDP